MQRSEEVRYHLHYRHHHHHHLLLLLLLLLVTMISLPEAEKDAVGLHNAWISSTKSTVTRMDMIDEVYCRCC